MTPVSQKEFAEILGLSERSIQNLIKEGLPVVQRGKPGRPAQIDPPEAIAWYVERAVDKKLKTTERKRTGEEREQQLDFWRVEKLRLETQQLEGKLIDREEVQVAINEAFVQISAGEDALPARVAVRLSKMSEPAVIRKVLLDELRANRANIAGELQGRGLDVDPKSSGPAKATTRKKRRPVGGRKQGAAARKPRARKVPKR